MIEYVVFGVVMTPFIFLAVALTIETFTEE
jgi:hypothetical protein